MSIRTHRIPQTQAEDVPVRLRADPAKLAVHELGEGEVSAFTRMYNAAFQVGSPLHHVEPLEDSETAAWVRGAQDSRFRHYLCTHEDEPVAWAVLNRFDPGDAYDTTAQLYLGVERAWRRRGVGSFLLGAIMKRAARLGFASIVALPHAHPRHVVEWLERAGFAVLGVLPRAHAANGESHDLAILHVALDRESTWTE